jgi:hypothetical protein
MYISWVQRSLGLSTVGIQKELLSVSPWVQICIGFSLSAPSALIKYSPLSLVMAALPPNDSRSSGLAVYDGS